MEVKKPPDDHVGMLVYKNQRLAERVEEQRREIRQLEMRLDEYDRQHEEYQETLLVVNRLWNQLNADMVFLITRTTGQSAPASISGADAGGGAAGSDAGGGEVANGEHPTAEGVIPALNGIDGKDPFVDKLLRGGGDLEALARSKQQEVADYYSDLEVGLRSRMAATNVALSELLELLNAERERYKALAAAAAESASAGGGVVSQPAAEIARLASENEGLRAALDVQQALTRCVEARTKAMQDKLDKDRVKIRELQSELADKSEMVLIAQRKAAVAAASTSAAPPPPPPPGGGAPAPPGTKSGTEPGELMEDPGLAVEVEELRKLLARRSGELQVERESVVRLQREVRDARGALQDESHVLQSRLYQLAQKQLNAMGADLDKFTTTIDLLQRDLSIAMQNQHDLKLRAEGGDFAKRALRDAEGRIADLEAKLAAMRAARDEAEVTLAREQERYGNARTVQELTVLLSNLQKENAVMRGQAARRDAKVERVEEAAKEVAAARGALEAKEGELSQARAMLLDKAAEMTALQGRQQQLKAQVRELQLFVEVLLTYADDSREAADVWVAEAQLREQVEALKAQLAGAPSPQALQQLKDERESAQRRADEAEAGARALTGEAATLRNEAAQLRQQLQALKEEADAYCSEVETIGSAYEEMQSQNTRLLAGITERDELNNKLLAERTRAVQAQGAMLAERDSAAARVVTAEAAASALQRRVVDMEGQLQGALGDAAAARDSARVQAARVESLGRELREKDDALAQSHVLLEAAQRSAAERKRGLEEEGDRLQRERAKRQRLEDDVKVLQGKVSKLRGLGEGMDASKQVQEELHGLRTLLRCSVCSERRKDTIITKCFHMFCNRCIQRNLDSRHRKCPGCNVGFGAGDVKSIYFS